MVEWQAAGDVSAAGLTDWKNLGLYGGQVQNAVYDPTRADVAYLATSGSFYKSTDGGETWSEMVDVGGQDVAVHPTTGRAYVIRGGSRPGLGFSDDGGATWTEYNEPSGLVWDMALDPNDQLAVFIATGGELSNPPTSGRIHRTLDGGQTWSVWDTGGVDPNQCMTSVAVNPNKPDIVTRCSIWRPAPACTAVR